MVPGLVRALIALWAAAVLVVASAGPAGSFSDRGKAPGPVHAGLLASRVSADNPDSELICGRAYHPARRGSLPPAPPSPPQFGPDEIALKQLGGTYLAPVLVNNSIVLDFHVDSGSADVSIPRGLFYALVRNGTIRENDFLGTRLFQLADGRNITADTFRIRSVRVGNHELENVVASVGDDHGSLLLGQSFLSRFSAWSIDNNRRVLVLR